MSEPILALPMDTGTYTLDWDASPAMNITEEIIAPRSSEASGRKYNEVRMPDARHRQAPYITI